MGVHDCLWVAAARQRRLYSDRPETASAAKGSLPLLPPLHLFTRLLAAFMLPAVTAAEAPDGRDFADLWEASEANKAADAAITASVEKGAAGPAPAAPGTAPGATPTEYAAPRAAQVLNAGWPYWGASGGAVGGRHRGRTAGQAAAPRT